MNIMVPKLIIDSWKRVNERIDSFCEGDDKHSFKILFITDVHIGAENYKHIKQLQYIKDLIKLNHVDLIVNGGDIGLDVGEDDVEAEKVIHQTEEATQYGIPYVWIKGNHDFKESIITDDELNKRLNTYALNSFDPTIAKIMVDVEDTGGYGYYIDKKTDTRLIFLNTSSSYRKYDVEIPQLHFLVNELEQVKEKNVIIISHYCINKCGEWVRYPNKDSDNMKLLKRIESDFAKKKKGGDENIHWDFSNSKSNLVLHLSGDSHFNNSSTSDGYLIACRQGYGGVEQIDIPEGGSFDVFDKDELCNFDILVINKKGHTKLFRVGVGEGIRDIDIQ